MLRRLMEPFRRRIALKLTLTLVVFVAVILVAAAIYLNRALEDFAVASLEARLAVAARLLHDEARDLLLSGASADDLRGFTIRARRPTDARVTLITTDGRVVADSSVPVRELSEVENHATREEIAVALQGGIGHGLRTSATVHQPLFYVAAPLRDGARVIGVLRLALPLAVVTSSYATLHHVLLVGASLALLLAAMIGIAVSRRITRPVVEMQAGARLMSEGDFAMRVPVRSVDEIGALGRALNTMAIRLREKVADLEDEHSKTTAILDAMVEGVVAVDGHDRIVIINERARAMFGLGDVRGIEKPLLEVIRSSELHALVRETRAAPRDTPVTRELSLSPDTGGDRRVHVNGVRLALTGDAPGVVMVLHDITPLRRLEQVRTEFIANVSHELRTPLTAIHGYLETLLGGALDDREHAQSFIEIAFRHTERLGRLIDDLTDLSNIELGRITLRKAPTSLPAVVESVLEIVRPKAARHDITVEAELPDALPLVFADRDRLAQILINLVDNAVKYSRDGGRVTITATPRNASVVDVSVLDAGVGIPAADLPRITERFYRVDKARSRAMGGTGLGLAIVKHLVSAHGGELRIESEVDRGTLVTFTVPAAPAGAGE